MTDCHVFFPLRACNMSVKALLQAQPDIHKTSLKWIFFFFWSSFIKEQKRSLQITQPWRWHPKAVFILSLLCSHSGWFRLNNPIFFLFFLRRSCFHLSPSLLICTTGVVFSWSLPAWARRRARRFPRCVGNGLHLAEPVAKSHDLKTMTRSKCSVTRYRFSFQIRDPP